MHGGDSAPSCCAFTHRVAFEEGLRGLQETRVATREESGVLGFPSRRGLTPRALHGPLFEGNPVGEGTTLRGTATPVHRLQRPTGSTHSSTRGLRPGLPVHHQLPEFTQTHVHRVSHAIQPSHPLSSPSPPAPNPSQHQSAELGQESQASSCLRKGTPLASRVAQVVSGPSSSCVWNPRVFADDAWGWQCPFVLCLHPQGCLRKGSALMLGGIGGRRRRG